MLYWLSMRIKILNGKNNFRFFCFFDNYYETTKIYFTYYLLTLTILEKLVILPDVLETPKYRVSSPVR